MSDGWTNKKRCYICNFFINSPKGIKKIFIIGGYF
jgi:hypothetical protein